MSVPSQARVFLAVAVTDMRKSFDGLCALVEHGFGRDPFTGDVFAFFNRRRTHVKLLVWDSNGFWLSVAASGGPTLGGPSDPCRRDGAAARDQVVGAELRVAA